MVEVLLAPKQTLNELLTRDQVAILINTILDRKPLIVLAQDPDLADEIITEIASFLQFRQELVFPNDFVDGDELNYIFENENTDFNIRRVFIRCPSSASRSALSGFSDFKGWLIAHSMRGSGERCGGTFKPENYESPDGLQENNGWECTGALGSEDRNDILDEGTSDRKESSSFDVDTEPHLESVRKILQKLTTSSDFPVALDLTSDRVQIYTLKSQKSKETPKKSNPASFADMLIQTSNTDLSLQETKMVEFKADKSIDFEKDLIGHVLKKTDENIERMQRILKKRFKGKDISDRMYKAAMDFEEEKRKIRANMFEEEISVFVHACRRALSILERINLIRMSGIGASIAGRTLLETIAYSRASEARILSFISSEWGEEMGSCLGIKGDENQGDWIDSLWS